MLVFNMLFKGTVADFSLKILLLNLLHD